LIVGAGGVFGSRLVEGLAETTDAQLIFAGRRRASLETLARRFRAEAATLDRTRAGRDAIAALAPAIVIDAAGPFQGADLRFATAVIEAGAHYLDLADARDFVAAFPRLDKLAHANGVAAITGASSTPALTHAALDELCAGWRRIDVVRAGIAPGNRAPRGRSLVEAILSRAGVPMRVLEAGAWRMRPGWSHHERLHIDGLGWRRFAWVDAPDLDLMAARFAPRESAIFLAALELALLHRGVEAVAMLRRLGAWPKPERAAAFFEFAAKLVQPFGSDRGAMFVEALGRDANDAPTHACWRLLAPAGRGPYAPTLPALALTRQLLAGDVAPGARACVGLVSLDALREDFRRHGFFTEITRRPLQSPFARALGTAFETAPAAVREAHTQGPVSRFVGAAHVEGAASPLAAFAAKVVGFPERAEAAPVRVTKRLGSDGVETWEREIGERRFRSRISYVGPGRVRERFGALSFDLRVWADADALGMEAIGWRLGPMPLPAWLAPRSLAFEREISGQFAFDVPIALPWLGRLTHYAGHLTPVDERSNER
jgi:hypothetical protein